MAIVTVFGEPILQGIDLLAQAAHLLTMVLDHVVLLGEQRLLLLDEFVSLHQLFSQYRILFSRMLQFFFDLHTSTLLGLAPFGKSPADLGSYQRIGISTISLRTSYILYLYEHLFSTKQ